MNHKNVWYLILGLLPLLLFGCTPEAQIEDAGQDTAVPAPTTPAPLPQPSEAPADSAEPTPLPGASAGVDFQATPAGQPTAPPVEEQVLQPAVQALVNLAQANLAARLDLPREAIELFSFELKEWPDGSLGCPQTGMKYTQVPQDGYLIRLQANDEVYHYHGGGTRDPFLCLQSSPQLEIVITRQPSLDIKEIATKIVPPPRDSEQP